MKKKENCWEYMQCGREPGGKNVAKRGLCPAATSEEYDGVNNGLNGGRFCWKISGTMCFDSIKGSCAPEITSCLLCPFFKKVKEEEGDSFA